MATLKVIRKRIVSVKNTQKITKAMKMVAAAKLRRAQTALVQARSYPAEMKGVLNRLVPHLEEEGVSVLQKNRSENAEVFVFTSDRGLCGGFNSNLLRKVNQFLDSSEKGSSNFLLTVFGRKGRDFFKTRRIDLKREITGLEDAYSFDKAVEISQQILESYKKEEISGFYIAYNQFKSAISQEISIRQILPLEMKSEEVGSVTDSNRPVIFEPSPKVLFEELLPRYLAGEIYLAMLESNASELGARMSAMENATNNAREMIGVLTLQYNRARQASITKELMDIVNGAESLK